MIRHVILWKLKEGYSEEDKQGIKAGIKEGLESLVGKIPGLVSIRVHTQGIPGSTADAMLDSEFESVDALRGYSVHPEHVAVANSRVRPHVAVRSCLDFEDCGCADTFSGY